MWVIRPGHLFPLPRDQVLMLKSFLAVDRGQYGHTDWSAAMQPHSQKTVRHWYLSIRTNINFFFFFFKNMLSNYTEYSSFVEIGSSKMDQDHLIKRKTELYTTDKISHFSCTINCNEYLSVLMHNTASFHVLNIYVSFFWDVPVVWKWQVFVVWHNMSDTWSSDVLAHFVKKKNPFYFMVSLHQRYPDCDYKSNFTSCV